MNDDELLRRVFKTTCLMVMIVLVCRFTRGAAAIAVALAGGMFAMQGKADKFLMCYLLLPFMIIMNPLVLGVTGSFYVFVRIGNLLLNGLMILRGFSGGRGRRRLPVAIMYAYLAVACLSSATGWFPLISYLKIVNFLLFFSGLYFAAQDMQSSDRVLSHVRVIFLSFAVILFLGSIAVLPFPAVAYLTSARSMLRTMGLEDANAVISEMSGMRLFAGITNHSQTLGPLSVCLGVWVVCDMLFVVKKFSKLHMGILAVAPIIFFMTRSRTAMGTFGLAMLFLYFYAVGKVRLSSRIKGRIRRLFSLFFVALVFGAVVAELKSNVLSRWIQKTDDVGSRQDSNLFDSAIESRMECVERNLGDFYRNPLLGMGFQVDEHVVYAYQSGRASLISASVEKGNVLAAVLAETGILGGFAFLCFLISFYSTCMSKRYMALMTMFTCFLISNMGECTFFSPTALGGIMWLCACIGGFCIDLIVIRGRQNEMQTGMRARAMGW